MRSIVGLLSVVLVSGLATAQMKTIEDFDGYAGNIELKLNWSGNVDLVTSTSTSSPNSMALIASLLDAGTNQASSKTLSPTKPFYQGTLSYTYRVSGLTNIPADQLLVELRLTSGPNTCTPSSEVPTDFDTWQAVAVSLGAACGSVDLMAVDGVIVQVINNGPTDGANIIALWDDIVITDAVPVELMQFEVD